MGKSNTEIGRSETYKSNIISRLENDDLERGLLSCGEGLGKAYRNESVRVGITKRFELAQLFRVVFHFFIRLRMVSALSPPPSALLAI